MAATSPPGGEHRVSDGEPSAPVDYEPPAILWEEPYEAEVLTQITCAAQPGQPGCGPVGYLV